MGEAARHKITGRSIVTAALIGLAEALEMKTREQLPIIETVPGGDGDPIDLLLDPDDPRLTVAFVKPWLRSPS